MSNSDDRRPRVQRAEDVHGDEREAVRRTDRHVQDGEAEGEEEGEGKG